MNNSIFLNPLVILIVSWLIFLTLYAWYRFSVWRKKVRQETKQAEETVKTSFDRLREKVEEEIEFLDNEPGLSSEEKIIRDKLMEALKKSEESIEKEVRDINRLID